MIGCVLRQAADVGLQVKSPGSSTQSALAKCTPATVDYCLRFDLCAQESDNVRSALLMKQAALGLLQTAPASLRKFAFTMVLAGLKYLNFSQRTLGIRCYL